MNQFPITRKQQAQIAKQMVKGFAGKIWNSPTILSFFVVFSIINISLCRFFLPMSTGLLETIIAYYGLMHFALVIILSGKASVLMIGNGIRAWQEAKE